MFMSLWDSLLVSEEILVGARSSKEGSYSISAHEYLDSSILLIHARLITGLATERRL